MLRRAEGIDPDRSNGYEKVAAEYMARRSDIGVRTIRAWSRALPPDATILDLGCGHGVPISQALIEDGFELYGVDASRTLIQEFRRRFPHVPVAHEAVEDSAFFNLSFDAVIAVGLMFLLTAEQQVSLIQRVAAALRGGGRFLFTAPAQACRWVDVMTGRQSQSLGLKRYVEVASSAGLTLVGTQLDEGENHYYDFVKGDVKPASGGQ